MTTAMNLDHELNHRELTLAREAIQGLASDARRGDPDVLTYEMAKGEYARLVHRQLGDGYPVEPSPVLERLIRHWLLVEEGIVFLLALERSDLVDAIDEELLGELADGTPIPRY